MSECRALTNISGNGVAAIVVSWWEGELNRKKLARAMSAKVDWDHVPEAGKEGPED
jgi:aerobic C4-dicarboxylate transport protein